ncbi:MAG: TlpA family protein disulfide reductase [Deltaproteobacteria bacterium]|nr:TlpA family protein disulfide reductase [Deltaproteobacteria bacterium]
MSDKKEEKGLPKAALAVIVLVVIAVAVFIVLGQKRKFEPVVAGSESIDFTLPDLSGKARSLKEFRGKVVFLNFWATWCKPCEEEMPSMQALYQGFAGQPFEIVAVSVDKDGPEVVAKYAQKYGLTFTILHDRKGSIKETYKTTGVPETFIIDQNGNIAEKVWGPRDWSDPASYRVIVELIKNGPKPKEAYKTVRGK